MDYEFRVVAEKVSVAMSVEDRRSQPIQPLHQQVEDVKRF